MMEVEQAVFTSAHTSRMRGYQLVARSAGITERFARAIHAWAPTHSALLSADVTFQSFNYLAIDERHVAVSRTIYGGPEYSARGCSQTVTSILLLRRDQLEGYGFNPLDLCTTAITLGHLRLSAEYPAVLPPIALPCETPFTFRRFARGLSDAERATLDISLRRLQQGQSVAIMGIGEPDRALDYLFRQTPPQDRLDLTFTTGLKPSRSRPFRIHFLSSLDPATKAQLAELELSLVPEVASRRASDGCVEFAR